MSITTEALEPMAAVQRNPPTIDVEKNPYGDITEASEAGNIRDDDKSEEYQQGVERVRAITAIWSKTSLISMFVL